MLRVLRLAWPVLVAGAALFSCSSSNSGGTGAGPASGTTAGSTSGAGGATGSGTGGGTGGSIYVDASFGPIGDGAISGTVGDASLGDAACATESRSADRVPLDLYLMLDSSSSMTDFVADGVTSKWTAVQKAITSFVNATSSAGLGVGLQYFPLIHDGIPLTCFSNAECKTGGPCLFLKGCSNDLSLCETSATCQGGTCDPLGACRSDPNTSCAPPGPNVYCDPKFTDPCSPVGLCLTRDVCETAPYAQPAVEVATLPGAAQAVVTSITAHMPDGATPTGPALQGALTHAKALATANPTHRVIVVLATDGLPTECSPLAIGQVAALATTAAQGAPSIATFVIGVFAPQEMATAQSNLDALAAAGNTGKAFIINTNQDVTTGFLGALNAIRTTALTCEYGIPHPDGGELDYSAVNVRFTNGAGQMSTIGYAGSAGGCTAAGGWYYDVPLANGARPSKIEICPSTCDSFKADTLGQVNILFGCQTIPIVR